MSDNLIINKDNEGIEHTVIYVDKKGNIINTVEHFSKPNKKNNNNKNYTVSDFCLERDTNKFIYIGEWKNDMREGKGTYYNPISKEKYEGEFQNGKAEGRGIYYYNNGDIYEGEFKNWCKDGSGIYYFINGDRYEGNFKVGLPDKKGRYFYKNEK